MTTTQVPTAPTATPRTTSAPRAAAGENFALSYRRLRFLIGLVGLTLPLTCLAAGLVDRHLESSISAYYYTDVTVVFTGTLCVIGVFLVAYRFGSPVFENVATSVAGVAALGVAFFHCAPAHDSLHQLRMANVHLTCAATLFVLLGAISLLVFPTDVPARRQAEALTYRGLGLLIWLSLALMPLLNRATPGFYERFDVFFALESVCVVAFSTSFLLKGRRLRA